MLTPEQREAIYRLALQRQFAELSDYLDSITAPTPRVVLPHLPTGLKTYDDDGKQTKAHYTDADMLDYARAALAQYGITEKNDE